MSKKRINAELKDIHTTIRHLFQTHYSLIDGKRHFAPHREKNIEAIKHRATLSEIAEQYDGTNYLETIRAIRNRAKRIIMYNDIF